jgi:hypothetical protein
VVITAFGAARLYRGLADFPVLNSSPKIASDTERVNELNREVTEVVSPCLHQPLHDAEGGLVVLDIRQVSTSGSEVHMEEETFEGGNIV